MELTELSLAPRKSVVGKSSNSSLSHSQNNPSRKRKPGVTFQASLDFNLKDPLPWDWEQCLDLESGRMYYVNRKALRKSWSNPKNEKLDLELNISTIPNSSDHHRQGSSSNSLEESNKFHSSSSDMVAVACANCHLLVILSRSCPSCPNCKYVHSLPTQQAEQQKVPAVRSLSTLSLLN